jgi:AcrR family transcriptional regulator
VDLDDVGPVSRRRGQELEDALLDAAWEELKAGGYGAFTIDSVAERAETSRPVLYRRWKNRDELMLAAIKHFTTRDRKPVPDTGTLRGDLIELLDRAGGAPLALAAIISVQLGSYYQATQSSPADLRQQLLGDRTTSVDVVIARAVERGEIDPGRLTPRIIALPFDLFRHEVMMNLGPIPAQTITEIVDDIFLPLVEWTDGRWPLRPREASEEEVGGDR